LQSRLKRAQLAQERSPQFPADNRPTLAARLAWASRPPIGEIGDAEKSEFLGNARALLFPIHWPEPFGLAMIEAMACGTPVIAWRNGSVPEVVDNGITGYIVDSTDEALAAIQRVSLLDRARVRTVFEQRFDAQTMARSYLKVYARLTDAARKSYIKIAYA